LKRGTRIKYLDFLFDCVNEKKCTFIQYFMY